MTHRTFVSKRIALLALATVAGGAACQAAEPDTDAVAEAQLEVESVPSTVRCLVVNASTPARQRHWVLALAASTTNASLALDDVPVGRVTFVATAYDADCATDGPVAGAEATWVADAQRVAILSGRSNPLNLVLHPAGGTVDGTVGFQTPVVQVALGDLSSYALLADGRVMAWGKNDAGQLGDGTFTATARVRPAPVNGLPGRVDQIAAGLNHACAIVAADGSVWCWGSDFKGQVGDGLPKLDRSLPVRVTLPPPGRAIQIAAGTFHTCALLTGGGLACWGSGVAGELGQGPAAEQAAPPLTSFNDGEEGGWVAVATGDRSTCALRNLGHLSCSQVNATTSNLSKLVPVVDLAAVTSFALGGGLRLAVRGDGMVLTAINNTAAALVPDLTDVVQVAVSNGSGHSCALRASGAVLCWGGNTHGQLGNGTVDASTTPRPVLGLTNVVQVAAGQAHTCAITEDGSLYCWGRNRLGALGLGDLLSRFKPTRVTF